MDKENFRRNCSAIYLVYTIYLEDIHIKIDIQLKDCQDKKFINFFYGQV